MEIIIIGLIILLNKLTNNILTVGLDKVTLINVLYTIKIFVVSDTSTYLCSCETNNYQHKGRILKSQFL